MAEAGGANLHAPFREQSRLTLRCRRLQFGLERLWPATGDVSHAQLQPLAMQGCSYTSMWYFTAHQSLDHAIPIGFRYCVTWPRYSLPVSTGLALVRPADSSVSTVSSLLNYLIHQTVPSSQECMIDDSLFQPLIRPESYQWILFLDKNNLSQFIRAYAAHK